MSGRTSTDSDVIAFQQQKDLGHRVQGCRPIDKATEAERIETDARASRGLRDIGHRRTVNQAAEALKHETEDAEG